MANNRKPKLATGSRWGEHRIVDADGDSVERWSFSGVDERFVKLSGTCFANTTDLTALIRTSKLDPVFDSAVALAEYWDGLTYSGRGNLAADNPELCDLLSANSAAVKGATDV